MKPGIHPNYTETTVTCACGNSFVTRSTKQNLRTDLCNVCHPFYTGEQRIVDTAGQVERFMRRMETASAADSRGSKRQLRLEARQAKLEEERLRQEELAAAEAAATRAAIQAANAEAAAARAAAGIVDEVIVVAESEDGSEVLIIDDIVTEDEEIVIIDDIQDGVEEIVIIDDIQTEDGEIVIVEEIDVVAVDSDTK